jgi:hypothetical protein
MKSSHHKHRISATKTTEYYIVDHMKIHPRHELPLTCPDRAMLNPLFSQSENFEKSLLGSVNPEHKLAFEKQVEENMFCSMNMRKILVSLLHISTLDLNLTSWQTAPTRVEDIFQTFEREISKADQRRIKRGVFFRVQHLSQVSSHTVPLTPDEFKFPV